MRRHTTIALLAALALVLVWTLGASGSALTDMSFPSTGSTGSTFQPSPVSPGMVSRQRAISHALQFALGPDVTRVPSGVHVRAYFGLYTDTLYTARQVWIVRLWGRGINVGGHGPYPNPGDPPCERPVAHEEIVVIDGKTGRFLEAGAGALPLGLPTIVTTPTPIPTPCPLAPPHAISPSTVAVGSRGNIFIGGHGPQYVGLIQKRSPSGKFLFSWPNVQPRSRAAHQILRVALDGSGNVYVVNADGLVQKYGPGGRLIWTWSPHRSTLHFVYGWWSMAVAGNGAVYVADRDNARIYVLSPRGSLIGRWRGRWDFLTVDAQGTLLAASVGRGLVQALSPTGHPLRHWLVDTDPGVGYMLAMGAGRDGTVSILEWFSAGPRPHPELARFWESGRLLSRTRLEAGIGPHALSNPRDLAIGPRGIIFIADSGNSRVVALSRSGRVVASWQL